MGDREGETELGGTFWAIDAESERAGRQSMANANGKGSGRGRERGVVLEEGLRGNSSADFSK